jgi:hypothetical protein
MSKPPIPKEMEPLPPLLTFGQVVGLCVFWNLGGRHYVEDLRDLRVIVSVNEFEKGQRARYRAERVLALYPVGG